MQSPMNTAPAAGTARAAEPHEAALSAIRIVPRGRMSRKRLVASMPTAAAQVLASELNVALDPSRWPDLEQRCPLAMAFVDALWDMAYGNTDPGEIRVVEGR